MVLHYASSERGLDQPIIDVSRGRVITAGGCGHLINTLTILFNSVTFSHYLYVPTNLPKQLITFTGHSYIVCVCATTLYVGYVFMHEFI